MYVFRLISQKFPQRCLQNSSNVRLVECCFTSTKTVGLLGMGAQDGHLDFHTAPELCLSDWQSPFFHPFKFKQDCWPLPLSTHLACNCKWLLVWCPWLCACSWCLKLLGWWSDPPTCTSAHHCFACLSARPFLSTLSLACQGQYTHRGLQRRLLKSFLFPENLPWKAFSFKKNSASVPLPWYAAVCVCTRKECVIA